jgi:hypothetical protein
VRSGSCLLYLSKSAARFGPGTCRGPYGHESEYPAGRYEGWIHCGDRFVHQVPGVGYIGCGIIGDIRESPTAGRLICKVLSVRLLEDPISLKGSKDNYYEADPTYWKDKVYWGKGGPSVVGSTIRRHRCGGRDFSDA